MNLLLDTSIFLRLAADPNRVAPKVQKIVDEAERVFLSAASGWEIAIKASIGKIVLPTAAGDYIRSRMDRLQVEPLDVTFAHSSAVESLPFHHRDPFDRLIIAQARVEGLLVVTSDRFFSRYGPAIIQRA